jgi:hypothetical protein
VRITKRQLRRIIREEAVKQTEKHDDDPALKGDQDELPDNLQKGIIDKAEEEEEEEKNESRKLTRRQLRKMIQELKEEKARLLEQQVNPAAAARTENQYGRTESGDPQSYQDFATRLDKITAMLEDLTMDYVDSDWLANGDHASLSADVENAFTSTDKLALAAMGLAQSMGEI